VASITGAPVANVLCFIKNNTVPLDLEEKPHLQKVSLGAHSNRSGSHSLFFFLSFRSSPESLTMKESVLFLRF
jgi:hypothetical protein